MEKVQKPAGHGLTQSTEALCAGLLPDILDHLQDAVFATDLRGAITACSQGVRRYGYTPEELVGRHLGVLFGGEQSVVMKQMLVTVREQGRSEVQLRGRSKADQEFTVHLCLTLLRDRNAAPLGTIAITIESGDPKTSVHVPGELPGRVPATSAPSASALPLEKRVVAGNEFIIASPVMHKFMGMVDRVAGHTETVLIIGETGVGKELVARTIHETSYRHHKTLVDINCAALPEHLVESELFGYEKGAFSGADSSKPGLFELADKSTIFLDEIGELQPQIQVKLLRVLDGAPYYRLGGHRKIIVDVRVVAATNQDLELAVKEGRFRKDLYHRLSQFQLRVPPLRERSEDIAALARYFLQLKSPDKTFAVDGLSALQSYDWPGNVRELRNVVAKLAMGASGSQITNAEVAATLHHESVDPAQMRQAMPQGNLENMEEQMIIRALEQTGGHRSQAADRLGISRRTLSRKLREYGINAASGRGAETLGKISQEQQKFFRAKVNLTVTLRNANGKEMQVQAVNLSTGGMGLDSVSDTVGFAGLVDVSFLLPDSDTVMQAKGRLVWADVGGRAGLRFVVVEPALFERLQNWTNAKMQDEGWDIPS